MTHKHLAEEVGMHPLKREHHTCEDCWYSCPLSEEGCCDEREEGCNCGAEEHNKKIDELLAYVRLIEDKICDLCESSFLYELDEIAGKRPKWLQHDAVSVCEHKNYQTLRDDKMVCDNCGEVLWDPAKDA